MISKRNAGLLLGLGVLGTFAVAPASAQLTNVKISQIYGGGGNTGAPINSDFVELFNNGLSAVDLTGTSVQYASATGNFNGVLPLVGTIQPNSFFLIRFGTGGANGTFTLTPDQTGTGSGNLNLSATNGKVALVNQTTALGTNPATEVGAPFIDYVGYGSADNFEGAGAAAVGSNTLSNFRNFAAFQAIDTNNNNLDFFTSAPVLRNSSTPAPIPAPSSVAVLAMGGLLPAAALIRRRAVK
jgi:uncharacterized protein